MRKHIALVTLLTMAASAPALASGNFSYNLIEAGYVSSEFDGYDLDGSGFALGVGGRYCFTPAFAAGVDVSDNDDGMAWTVMLRYDFGNR